MDYFTLALKDMIDASENQDGIMLQKLESDIIDAYKSGRLTHYEYETLTSVNVVFMKMWRKEGKQCG